MANFNYISLDRIESFSKIMDLSEDPSILKEVMYKVSEESFSNNRYKRICREIVTEGIFLCCQYSQKANW